MAIAIVAGDNESGNTLGGRTMSIATGISGRAAEQKSPACSRAPEIPHEH